MRAFPLAIVLASSLALTVACDDARVAESAASHARDSALKRDLELAQAQQTTPGGASRTTTGRTVSESPGVVDAVLPSGSAAASAINASNTRTPSAEGYIGPSCASPALDDQRRCLSGYLARSDAQLDRNYQALITQLKSEAATRKGAPEPRTVERLRNAQRAWLVYRDEECRKRTRPQEGPLWAPVRAQCLAEYSMLRARELTDALADRKALTARTAASKTKSTTARKVSRQRSSRGR